MKSLNEILLNWDNDIEDNTEGILSSKDIQDILSYNPNCLDFTAIYRSKMGSQSIQVLSNLWENGITHIRTESMRYQWKTYVDKCLIWIDDKHIDLPNIKDEKASDFWDNFFKGGCLGKGCNIKKDFSEKASWKIRIYIEFKKSLETLQNLFKCNNCLVELVDIKNTKGIQDTQGMFSWCRQLEKICLFDTQSVLDASKMFYASSIKTIPDGFNWKKLLFCDYMFASCDKLEGPLPPFNNITMPWIVKSSVNGFFKGVPFSWWKQYNQGFK